MQYLVLILTVAWMNLASGAPSLEPLMYNHPGLVVDLGVGLWAQPLPMDYDGDGDLDLLVATANVPSKGIYFFENQSGKTTFPLFRPGVRLGPAKHNLTVSYGADGAALVQGPGEFFPDFRRTGISKPRSIGFNPSFQQGRAKQWKRCDYDGDGVRDLVIGVSDWRDYGWDNAFDREGRWTRGPLHGYVYVARNEGTDAAPVYGVATQVKAAGKVLDVYGCPSPNFADWDGDGDLDLICGSFLDAITYFENVGTRQVPRYGAGEPIRHAGRPITMDLQMLQVVALDWDGDGDTDLVVGQEDGRVALIECVAMTPNQAPEFLPPRFFQQEADRVKVGALCTPYSMDWDGDGDADLIVGDTAGYVSFVENLDGGNPPRWAKPVYLKAGGEVLRIQAGPNGSIQGPAEAKWGYTVVSAADWDLDGLPDLMFNSIWGAVMWCRNVGTRESPRLAAPEPVEVAWPGPAPKPAWVWWEPKGNALVTQWRTSPVVFDLNEDGLPDLVMLDHEGYLAFFERRRNDGSLELLPGKRVFLDAAGKPLRLNDREAGKSGRRKLVLADWDGDGRVDILVNGKCIDLLRNVGDSSVPFRFDAPERLGDRDLAGHTTCPTVVDWDRNGIPDLLIGAEDGFFYFLKNPRG